MDAIVFGPGEGEPLNERIVVKIERPELSVNEVSVGPDFQGPDPHLHKEHVDAFYVLEGRLEFTLGTETMVAGAGTSIAIPPGIVHAFTNAGPGRARYINIHAPDQGFIEVLRRRIRGEEFDETEHDIWDVDEPRGPSEAAVARPGKGERFEDSARSITMLVERPELCVLDFSIVPRWPGVPPHVHDDQVDSFYVLEGELELEVEGARVLAGPGTYVAAPPGTEHGIVGAASGARFLNLHAPDAGFAAFIRSL